MRKVTRITILLVAAVCMSAIFAQSAFALSGYWLRCESCHAVDGGATVTATLVSNDGTTTVYDITTTGATEWALFAGYTKRAGGVGSSATVSVPSGATYEIYAVSGTPGSGTYAKTIVSPASSWVMPATDDFTAPVSSSDAVASYTNRATITINATDSDGVEGPAWGVGYIYFSVDGGATRMTPIGSSGYAIAVVQPNTAGTSSHTLEFWATDRAGNDEAANTVAFDVVRAAEGVMGGSAAPTVMAANGASRWSYQDLYDAFEKYEGGYVAFGGTTGYYANPHGGYDTTTNKCKVCHAVHRAEGAYYLLRADSQDDACDYCHIGGSAHSSKVVYDLNSAGKATPNGHTIGASTYIPDSTIAQWTETVTLETVDADMNPLTEDIEVRAYDEQKNDMYRFARHHGHSAANGGARRNYVPVGPLALRCMSCHQVHDAEAQTWQSISMASMGGHGEYNALDTDSYKLLKQFPSGTFVGGTDSYGQIPLANISLVPETTLTAGVNFDAVRAMGADPSALSLVRDFNDDGDVADAGETVAYNMPMWVAQGFDGEHDPSEVLAEEAIAASVNNAALSVWCADCHNLNIGGWEHLANPELGFKAHTERTHPAPYTGAHSGPGQCYSCHRNDLPRIGTAGGAADSCSQCHYGTGNYRDDRYVNVVESDFPHSGEDADYKMLGSYSIVQPANTVIDDAVTIGADNLDAVCIRCHGGIGTFH